MINSSLTFCELSYLGSSQRHMVKILEAPKGYKSKILQALKETPNLASNGGKRGTDVQNSLAKLGLKEVEIRKSRNFTTTIIIEKF